MTYPVFDKEESICAKCGKNLFDEDGFSTQSYITVRDNFMVLKFFQFEDGQDNMFCDEHCLAEYLSAEEVEIER